MMGNGVICGIIQKEHFFIEEGVMKEYNNARWRRSMKLKLDINGMMKENVGIHGLDMDEIESRAAIYERVIESAENKRDQMKWRFLPHCQGETVAEIKSLAKELREKYDAFVVLGIGGSALGPIAVQQALNHMRYNELDKARRNGPKFYVEDNIDPERMAQLLDVIDVERTVFNVITKSGSTSETMSQLLYIVSVLKERLGDNWTEHIIATTDRASGNLIKIAKRYSLKTLFVPDGVGGRFSELCPVGLLPASVCGIDIEMLLAGGAYMDELCSERDYRKNIAFMAAVCEVEAMRKGANISVMMPYADSLKYIADWYAQLWAESLGKKVDNGGNTVHTGQTPVKALGVTDQHSQVQLYTEGPFDKVITFIGVDKFRHDVQIPNGFEDFTDVAFLGGQSFNKLIKSEQSATEYAVTKSGHMNKTITLSEINPFTIGQLLYFFEMQTAYAGELLNINAFDQPGVEEGKKATYALMGKAGYDEKRRELSGRAPKQERYIL